MLIGVLCKNRSDREWVTRLREWSVSGDWVASQYVEHVDFLSDVEKARAWCAEAGNNKLLIAMGCSGGELNRLVQQDDRQGSPDGASLRFPVIVSGDTLSDMSLADGSDRSGEFYCATNPVNKLREIIIQEHFRDRGEISMQKITEHDDLEHYFRLRFRIWNKSGFIPEARRATESAMEIEYSDRFATPFGAYEKGGALTGCARLVNSFGRRQPYYETAIQAVIETTGDRILIRSFNQPESPWNQPFDILEHFPGFRAYYRRFVTDEYRVGEVSRVIVDEPYRGNHIADLLVHEIISHARSQQITHLLLACRLDLIPMYEACGFATVRDLEAIQFGSIPVKSYVMEMQL